MALVHSSALLLLAVSPGLFLMGLVGIKLGAVSLLLSIAFNLVYYCGILLGLNALLQLRKE